MSQYILVCRQKIPKNIYPLIMPLLNIKTVYNIIPVVNIQNIMSSIAVTILPVKKLFLSILKQSNKIPIIIPSTINIKNNPA